MGLVLRSSAIIRAAYRYQGQAALATFIFFRYETPLLINGMFRHYSRYQLEPEIPDTLQIVPI